MRPAEPTQITSWLHCPDSGPEQFGSRLNSLCKPHCKAEAQQDVCLEPLGQALAPAADLHAVSWLEAFWACLQLLTETVDLNLILILTLSQSLSQSTPSLAKHSKCTKAEQAAEPSQPTKGKGKAQGKAAKAKPGPQPGRWLDRDCNEALNMQRIGESRWRPLELCYWPDQAALPAKGKEYPGLGYKRVRDKPPLANEQQPPAVAQ
ncbi:hypothetical protein QJQ45_009915 [Haematococcus lacustris]|nr:hypothetical protein QJQ45_009915 [Haematococcus lacustris]